MKKLLLSSLLIVFHLYFGQIQFGPYVNHSYEPYTATIQGTGTIYYTTDGTDPTNSSSSGISNVNVTISKNTVLKAKLANGQVFTRNYYYGELPQKTVYFKPPSSWNPNYVCVWPTQIEPQSLIDYLQPPAMTNANCEGWYKLTSGFYKSGFVFNNCLIYVSNLYIATPYIETENTIYYDFSAGPISNPPACLLAVNDPSKKVAMVKIFPNPVQDYINIESDKTFIAYEVIDESGKVISKNDFKGHKIDISGLGTGVYFIKLKSLSNETNIVKFIKK